MYVEVIFVGWKYFRGKNSDREKINVENIYFFIKKRTPKIILFLHF